MQYQKNKLNISERSNNIIDNSKSNFGEIAYIEPIGNQIISPISNGEERSFDLGEKIKNRENIIPNPQFKNNKNIIQTVKNDLKNKVDIEQLDKEKQMEQIIVNIPNNDSDYNRGKSFNNNYIRSIPKKENKHLLNLKKINPRQKIKNNYQTSTNPQLIDSRNFTSSNNDSGQFQQIIYDPNFNITSSRSPEYHHRKDDNKYIIKNYKRGRGGIIPLNNMSPNLNNYEDMNSSDQKFDIQIKNLILLTITKQGVILNEIYQ